MSAELGVRNFYGDFNARKKEEEFFQLWWLKIQILLLPNFNNFEKSLDEKIVKF